jgi:hypothetical protein
VASKKVLPLYRSASLATRQGRGPAPTELLHGGKGHTQKKTNARVHLQNPLFFPRPVFLVVFSGASRQVEFKNTKKTFEKKSMSKMFSKK